MTTQNTELSHVILLHNSLLPSFWRNLSLEMPYSITLTRQAGRQAPTPNPESNIQLRSLVSILAKHKLH